jgi:N utilization substance protein B
VRPDAIVGLLGLLAWARTIRYAQKSIPARTPLMNQKSRAREVAMQLLFQRDINPNVPRSAIERFARERLNDQAELTAFALTLYDSTCQHNADIDARLRRAAENWRLERMAKVDRNVLRLGTCELLHVSETPPNVAIDEAIELARRFGSADSPAFVNGVLDRVRKDSAA